MKRKFSSLSLMPELQDAMTTVANYYGRAGKPLPPVFITLPGAVEPEPLIENLCDELERGDYLAFTGLKRWLNMRLDYTEGAEFPSFALMMESMNRHAGYYNCFHGVVLVDLTQWIDHTDDHRFEAVLAFIHDFSDDVFFMLYVTVKSKDCAEPMKKELGRWIYSVDADVETISHELLMSILENKLISEEHVLSTEARNMLCKTVEKLSEQNDFAGLREIDSLAEAICMRTTKNRKLSVRNIGYFSVGGDWLRQRLGEEKVTIGFTGGKVNEKQ